jgi:hypothetical protein
MKMIDAKSIIDLMLAHIQEKDVQIEMYFIKKSNSRMPEKMNRVFSVSIAGDVKIKFTKTIVSQLNTIKIQDLKFKDFFASDLLPEHEHIAVIENLLLIPTFRYIDMRMEQHTNLDQIKTFEGGSIEGFHSYAVEFKSINNKVIYFRKYTKGSVISSENTLFSFKDGIFNRVYGDVCKFDDFIDCVYYKLDNIHEIMYILNRNGFESIFSLLDLYINESKKVFEKLTSFKNFEIQEDLRDQILDKPAFLKRIARLSLQGGFDKIDINRISKIKKMVPYLKFEVKNNKIVISDKDCFKDFLDVCEKNILKDLVDEEEFFRTRYKEPLK